MLTTASRLALAMRWLPLVVLVGLAGPSVAGWSSAVTVLAQADGEDQQPADTPPAPAADYAPPVLEDTPADAALPAADETMPAADNTQSPQPQAGEVQLCVTVTTDTSGTITAVAQPCPPDAP